jgi:Uncharacterised protein conserved in bacteria (DUF2336)
MESQNFFDLDGLTDLSKRSGIDMRPTLLRVLTDLYVHRLSHSADEERHYTELALPMLEAVDVPTRIAVAKRFAHYQRPPLRVLQWLARDLPMVAGELRSHPPLQAPGAVPRGNGAAAPDKIDPPGEEHQPRPPVESIDAAAATELNELFFTATTTERRLILLNMHVVDPSPTLRSGIVTGASIGQELEGALLTGKREHFAARLAQALRIPHEQARRIANDELGEPVLVAAKTLALRRDVLYRLLMFVNPAVGHSVERVHTLAGLYDALQTGAAEAMLAIWQALPAAERPRFGYRPQAQDESRPRLRAGTATQRAPATPQTKELRSVS